MRVSVVNVWNKAFLLACLIEIPGVVALAMTAQSASSTLGLIVGWYHLGAFLVLYKAKLHWEPLNGPWYPQAAYWCALYVLQVLLTTPIVLLVLTSIRRYRGMGRQRI